MNAAGSPTEHTDVVVIGAGAAGLAAAAELDRRGVDFRVLEPRSRVGGRAHTIVLDGSVVELGAEFVHGEAKVTIDWLDRLGLPYYEVAADHWRRRGTRLQRMERFWEGVAAVMRRLDASREPDRSFSEFLATRPGGRSWAEHRKMARSFVQGFHAADLDRIGERGLAAGGDVTGQQRMMRIIGGYGALLERIAAPLHSRLRLGVEVTGIAWQPGAVRVRSCTTGAPTPGRAVRTATRRSAACTPRSVSPHRSRYGVGRRRGHGWPDRQWHRGRLTRRGPARSRHRRSTAPELRMRRSPRTRRNHESRRRPVQRRRGRRGASATLRPALK